ncbi:GntR family transcriptional regulator, partial [Clostridioides difficile]|uniref:GntR family transcriptional regulator n=5 Tax=Clostridioides difficile TaxID=1496 RepID=UPI0029C2E44F
MNFELDNTTPIYLQIVKYIKRQIVTGELKPGETIPSRREMALNLKVNLNTVQRAYKEMGDMNIINTFKNYQSSVTVDENILKNLKLELINESLSVFIEDMKAKNVSQEEVFTILDAKYKIHNK